MPTAQSAVPLIFVGSYGSVASQAGGTLSNPEWTSDTYTTPGATKGKVTYADYVIPPGGIIGRFYYCDNLGRIYEEDDSDTIAFDGTSIVVPAYLFFGDPGGGRGEGKKIVRLWSYVVSEDSAWRLRVWPGGEYAFVPNGILNQPIGGFPQGFSNYASVGFKDDVAASRKETFPLLYDGVLRRVRHQPLTVHSHITDGVPLAGRGFTFEYAFFNPIGAEFIGFGGVWEPGDTSRPVWLVTAS